MLESTSLLLALIVALGPGVFAIGWFRIIPMWRDNSVRSVPVTIVLMYAGFYCWSWVIYKAPKHAFLQNYSWLMAGAAMLFVLGAIFIGIDFRRSRANPQGAHLLAASLVTIGAVILCYFAYPGVIFGWDVMYYWGNWAREILEIIDLNRVIPPDASLDFVYSQKHAFYLVGVIAWIASVSSYFDAHALMALFWMLPLFASGLCLAPWEHPEHGSTVLSVIAFYTFLALPLLENHALLAPGYAEIHTAVLTLASVLCLCRGTMKQDWQITVCGFVGLMLVGAMRNTGIIMSAVLILTYCYVWALFNWTSLWRWYVNRWTRFIILLGPYIVGLAITGYTLSYVGTLDLGGETFSLQLHPLFTVLTNMAFAYFVNSSYSVVFFAFFIALTGKIGATRNAEKGQRLPHDQQQFEYVLLMMSGLTLISLLFCFQWLTDHAFMHSAVGYDTVGSRQSMVAATMCLFCVLRLVCGMYIRPK